VDICAEELHNSVPAKVAVHADIGVFVRQLIEQLSSQAWCFRVMSPWWGQLNSKSDENKAVVMVSCFMVYMMALFKLQTLCSIERYVDYEW
jgi:thiamine pyrophosphate-dependent acetolactate synthase large subunit-like protein